jgi:hypothetical protein
MNCITTPHQFLDYLRSALDTRSSAAARVAQINGDGIEGRAFLPGSPALWGWTTNMTAEAAVLQAAMQSSVFDSPAASCSNDNQDVFVDINSSEAMGGATLRDIYAKAWEVSYHKQAVLRNPFVLMLFCSFTESRLYGHLEGQVLAWAPRLGR